MNFRSLEAYVWQWVTWCAEWRLEIPLKLFDPSHATHKTRCSLLMGEFFLDIYDITSHKSDDISVAREVQLLVRLHLIFDHVYISSLHTTPNPAHVGIGHSSVYNWSTVKMLWRLKYQIFTNLGALSKNMTNYQLALQLRIWCWSQFVYFSVISAFSSFGQWSSNLYRTVDDQSAPRHGISVLAVRQNGEAVQRAKWVISWAPRYWKQQLVAFQFLPGSCTIHTCVAHVKKSLLLHCEVFINALRISYSSLLAEPR